jgi:glycolate oxidase FAD binding subunit
MSVETGFRQTTRREVLAFAEEVGAVGPVSCVGGRTHWDLGGMADPTAREVRAPAGVVRHEPDEMIVRVGAGTPVAEVDAVLAASGQCCPLDPARPDMATVGGVLATGRSGVRRLRYGPVRDLLLEARYVTANGEVAVAGAPVVKNVTGFDLARLLVGAYGTLGFFGEVVLRCRPKPQVSQWFLADSADPFALRRELFAPSSVLWDGSTTWVLLEGSVAEVNEESGRAGVLLRETQQPNLPTETRLSIPSHELRGTLAAHAAGSFVAEIGVGTVHASWNVPTLTRTVVSPLHAQIKHAYDPTGRLNPGRQPW